MIFSIMVFCSESVALSQFYHNLLSTQSPRTVIKATVNTIESGNLKQRISRGYINKVFLTLDNVFNFRLGKIYLATANILQLQSMMDKNNPYFTKYSQDKIDQCLSGTECTIIQTLGKFNALQT